MPRDDAKILQVTWNWRATPGRRRAPARTLRRAAIIQAAVMGLVAAVLQFGFGHLLAGRVVAALAVCILLLGLVRPDAYRPVHRFGRRLGRGVGAVLTHLLLVPFFFLFFVPVALWLRLRGRDPLHRRWRDAGWTYWIARRPQAAAQNIDRQFLAEDRAARAALREVGSLPERGPGERP